MLSKLRGALGRKRTPQTSSPLIEPDPQDAMLSRLRGALGRKEPEVEWSRTPAADARPQDLPDFVCVDPRKKLAAALRAETLYLSPLEVGLYSVEQAATPAFKEAFRQQTFTQGVLYRQHMDKRIHKFFQVCRFDDMMESERRSQLWDFAQESYSRLFRYEIDEGRRESIQATFSEPTPERDVMPDFGDLSEWFWVKHILRRTPWPIVQEILLGEQHLTFCRRSVSSIASENAEVNAVLAKCGVDFALFAADVAAEVVSRNVHISIARHERAVYEALPKQVDLTRAKHREDSSRAFRAVAVQRWRNLSTLPHVRSDMRHAGLTAAPPGEARWRRQSGGKDEMHFHVPIVLFGDEGAGSARVRSTWTLCSSQATLERMGPACRDPLAFEFANELSERVCSAAFQPTETADTGLPMHAAHLETYDCAPAASLDAQADGTPVHFGARVLVIDATDADAQLAAGGDGSAWRAMLLPAPVPVLAAEATGAATAIVDSAWHAPLLPAPGPVPAPAALPEAAASGPTASPVVACILGNTNDLDEARVEELRQWLGTTLRMAPRRIIPMRTFTFASPDATPVQPPPFPAWDSDAEKFAREREMTLLSALKALERLLDVVRDAESAAIARYRSTLPEQGAAGRMAAALARTFRPYVSGIFEPY